MQSMMWHIPHQCQRLIALLPIGILQDCPNFAKRCWTMQANTKTLCNVKVGTGKHGTPTTHLQGIEEGCTPLTMWSTSFGFAMMTSNIV